MSKGLKENLQLKLQDTKIPINVLAKKLLEQALSLEASDLHIEPQKDHYRIRTRVDATLFTMISLTKTQGIQLCAHIKALSELNIAEQRLPQDGSMTWPEHQPVVQIRVSTLTNIHGEKLVLRLHQQNLALLNLQQLNLSQDQQKIMLHVLSQPQGLILVTGPTGSGKTKTLYTALSYLNQEHRHIATVEDPVEIHLPGVHQIQVQPHISMDFPLALRALLRQDPDILMIGELRDASTADIACKAAQTGHLVLSSMHTNSASESFSRLMNLGIAPSMVTEALQLIMSQRLIRKLCPLCKKPDLEAAPKLKVLHATLSLWENNTFYCAEGCSACIEGYLGRTAIFELLYFDRNRKQQILKHQDATFHIWLENSQHGLLEAGLNIVASGASSLDELLRTLTYDHRPQK